MHNSKPSLFALCLMLSIPLSSNAHEIVPKGWCLDPSTVPVVIAEFEFDETQLLTQMDLIEATHQHTIDPKNPDSAFSRCGIADRWSWSALIAQTHCASLATDFAPMPVVLGPETFLEPRHHENYKFRDGLKAVCVVCERL